MTDEKISLMQYRRKNLRYAGEQGMNQAEIRRRQAQAVAAMFSMVILAAAARLTGYNGATYVSVALETYALLYALVSGGVSDVLGRLLKIKKTKGQYKNAARMRRNVMLFQTAFGAVGTVAVAAASEQIAGKLFRIQYSAFLLAVIAPAVFLRAVSEVLSGYCKGDGAELPSAAAGISRQLFWLGFGVLFCRILKNYGEKVSHLLVQQNFASMYGGVGVVLAITLSEILVAAVLFLFYKSGKRSKNRTAQEGMRTTASFSDSIMALFGGRGALAGIQFLLFLSLPIGLILFGRAAENGDRMAADYGVYLAGYGAVCGVFALFAVCLLIPVCGKTFLLMRKEEHRFVRTAFQGGIHIGTVHTVFFAVFLAVMSEQVTAAVCGEQAAAAAKMFRGGSAAIVFAVLSYYFARMLILAGKKYLVLGAAAVADVLYAVLAAVFLNVGKAGILSLVYAGIMGSGVLCISLGTFACRQFRLKVDWLQTFAVPAIMACVTGFAGMFLGKVFTPHLGNLVTGIVCFVLMSALYWVGLILLRNFRDQELEGIPGGKIIEALGQMLRVF
ncbi:MAG: hypothetical protein NC541_00510 [bacterium]|nr:hypothetical protein [bacterium]